MNLKLFLDDSDDYSVMPVTVGDKPQAITGCHIGLGKAEELAKEFEE